MNEFQFPKNILTSLFYMIKRSRKVKPRHGIQIPHTIHITDEPVEWFFTNKEGYLKKKYRLNVNVDNIYKEFCRKQLKNGVVAKLIYLKKNHLKNEKDEEPPYVVEYFDKFQLSKFLR